MPVKQGRLTLHELDALSQQICECQERILITLARGAPRIDVQLPKLHPRLFDQQLLRSDGVGGATRAVARLPEDYQEDRHYAEREPLMDGASIDNIDVRPVSAVLQPRRSPVSLSQDSAAAAAAAASASASSSQGQQGRQGWQGQQGQRGLEEEVHEEDADDDEEGEEGEEEEWKDMDEGDLEEDVRLKPRYDSVDSPQGLSRYSCFGSRTHDSRYASDQSRSSAFELAQRLQTRACEVTLQQSRKPRLAIFLGTMVLSVLLTAFLETYQFQPEHGLPIAAAATCLVCFLGLSSAWLLMAQNLHSMLRVIFDEVLHSSASLMEQARAEVCDPIDRLDEAYDILWQCQADLISRFVGKRQPRSPSSPSPSGGVRGGSVAEGLPSEATLQRLAEPLVSSRHLLEASLEDARASAPVVIDEVVHGNDLGEIATSRQTFLVKVVITPLALSLLLNVLSAALEANWLIEVAEWHGAVPSLTFFTEEDDPDGTPDATGAIPSRIRPWVAISLFFLLPLLQNSLVLVELLALSAWFSKRRLGRRINKALVSIQRDFSLQVDARIAATADHVFHSVFGEMRVASAEAFAKQTKGLEELRSALAQEEEEDATWETPEAAEANVPNESPTSADDFELI